MVPDVSADATSNPSPTGIDGDSSPSPSLWMECKRPVDLLLGEALSPVFTEDPSWSYMTSPSSSIPSSKASSPPSPPAPCRKKFALAGPLKMDWRSFFGRAFFVLLSIAPLRAAFTAAPRAALSAAAPSDMSLPMPPPSALSLSALTLRCRRPAFPPVGVATSGILLPLSPALSPCNGLCERTLVTDGTLRKSASRSGHAAAALPVGLDDLVAAAESTAGAGFEMPHPNSASFTASLTARTLSTLAGSRICAMRFCSCVGLVPGAVTGERSKLWPKSTLSPITCKTSMASRRVCQSAAAFKQLSRQGMRAGRASSNSAPSTACIRYMHAFSSCGLAMASGKLRCCTSREQSLPRLSLMTRDGAP
mmetsp:Transcript_2436/g.5232  ORF Transcript_2436/g.5232 Transcript_2436/m.5232 type:complete len:364 (-) Transcript_2436:750-1841(-)